MNKKINNKFGITFTEIMIATLVLAVVLLPSFGFLTNSVKDTERVYVETVALNHARQTMDAMLNSIPWEAMKYYPDEDYCIFKSEDEEVQKYIAGVVPVVFGNAEPQNTNKGIKADGLDITDKGFLIRTRAMVYYYGEKYPSGFQFKLRKNENSGRIPSDSGCYIHEIKDVVELDSENEYNFMKKIIVQVKYTLKKQKDPKDADANSRSIFLIAYKSRIEG